MSAGTLNLIIEQGATFSRVLNVLQNDIAFNLTGYDARMQIRSQINSSTTLISLAIGSGITIVGASGQITITISAAATAVLSFDSAYYDLEIISPSGVVTRLLQGIVELSREVTR
jgi:hypothetical protein